MRHSTAGTSPKTEPTLHVGGHDADVRRREEDDLDRWGFALSICRTIKETPKGWSTRLGVYGPWGTGKTSVLNFLESMAQDDGHLVVRFSAWRATGESGVIAQFHGELLEQLQRDGVPPSVKAWAKPRAQALAAKGRVVLEQAAKAAEQVGTTTGTVVSSVATVAAIVAGMAGGWLSFTEKDLAELHQSLGGRRLVVFIDDLDRADPHVVPKTLLTLRELLGWRDFAFVLAFDKVMVGSALGAYSVAFGEAAEQFLEKVVDVPFTLPAPRPEQITRLALKALSECCPFIPSEVRQSVAPLFPANPRQAKLVVRTVRVLREAAGRHDADELAWRAIVLQRMLQVAAPKTAALVETRLLGEEGAALRIAEGRRSAMWTDVEAAITDAEEAMSNETRRWLRQAIGALLAARHGHSKAKIDYEMQLTVQEPSLTWHEYRAMAHDWWELRDDARI
ncbi:KAP family P-loop NTPase fold protein [Eleftheria terrae]|uniref:KAP family P-loop NTPase fold protein n=1 Tax=Eleftheria terrae TaxID=1597781 RepID=UPI00263ADD5D|nr:P-loop NTPase fold protein [Eleftheria terrae]WKB54410.1 KAP family NTPase [Eleftheria terrae]